ncbi:MAG: chemotaxis protein CheW [Chitinivibrionales bacterium]
MSDVVEEKVVSEKNTTEIGNKLAGKYLTFKLGEEEYGLEILKVQEIIQMQEVTHVPRTPDYVRGVINLRGKVIPVIELRRKFGMQPHEDTEKTCIIVVQIADDAHAITMGIIIDEVKEVLDIDVASIEETPAFGESTSTEFIMGMGKVGDTVKMLLDINKVLSDSDINSLAKIARK